jgi:hypothetical protein
MALCGARSNPEAADGPSMTATPTPREGRRAVEAAVVELALQALERVEPDQTKAVTFPVPDTSSR